MIDRASLPEPATRVWISSFQPITVTTDNRQGLGRLCTPVIPKSIALQWRTNYAFFSGQLLAAAEKAHLDFRSLKKILSNTWDSDEVWAMLPVEVTSTRFKDEPVWIVEFRWELKDGVGDGYIGHFSRRTISRKTLKLITIEECD